MIYTTRSRKRAWIPWCALGVILAVPVVLGGCRTSVTPPLKEGQPYHNAARGVTITFPTGWTVQDNAGAAAAAPATADQAATTSAPAPASTDGTAGAAAPSATTSTAGSAPGAAAPAEKPAAPEKPAGGVFAVVATATKPGGNAVITVEDYDIGYEIPVDEFAPDAEARRVASLVTEYQRPPAEMRDFIGACTGKTFAYSARKNGTPMRGIAYAFVKGKKGYLVNGIATEKAFGGVDTIFNKVAASLALQ